MAPGSRVRRYESHYRGILCFGFDFAKQSPLPLSQSCSASCGAGSPKANLPFGGRCVALRLMQKKRDQPHSEEAFGKIPIYYLRMTFDKIGGRCDLILYPSSSFKEKLILQLAIFFFLYSKGMWSLLSISRRVRAEFRGVICICLGRRG
jgi:hypothetical protein